MACPGLEPGTRLPGKFDTASAFTSALGSRNAGPLETLTHRERWNFRQTPREIWRWGTLTAEKDRYLQGALSSARAVGGRSRGRQKPRKAGPAVSSTAGHSPGAGVCADSPRRGTAIRTRGHALGTRTRQGRDPESGRSVSEVCEQSNQILPRSCTKSGGLLITEPLGRHSQRTHSLRQLMQAWLRGFAAHRASEMENSEECRELPEAGEDGTEALAATEGHEAPQAIK